MGRGRHFCSVPGWQSLRAGSHNSTEEGARLVVGGTVMPMLAIVMPLGAGNANGKVPRLLVVIFKVLIFFHFKEEHKKLSCKIGRKKCNTGQLPS